MASFILIVLIAKHFKLSLREKKGNEQKNVLA